MPPLGTSYQQIVVKTDNYTLVPADDVAKFTIATNKTATLPQARTCTVANRQFRKVIASVAASAGDLTIAVASGDTLIGESTLSGGETAFLTSDGVLTWNSVGASGAAGTSGVSGSSGISGFSGASGYSGYTGISGYSGFCGISGYTGRSGYTGVSGISGYSGFSGISGYTGFSGYSGYTGV